MALTWDTTKCDGEKVRALDGWAFEHIIFCTMFTGIGPSVTEDNVAEFFTRIRVWEQVYATNANERRVTPAEVEAMVGLHVNVPPWTATRFANEMRRQLIDNVTERAQREWKEAS